MLNNGMGMVYQVLNNRIEYCGKRSQLFFFLRNSKPNFVSISLREEGTKPLDLKRRRSPGCFGCTAALPHISCSNSPDAWEGAILFSNVFIHGSDILNNLCVPAELQSKLIFDHIP